MNTDPIRDDGISEHQDIRAGWQGVLERLPAAVYTCDADGLLTYFNPAAAAMWGREPRLGDGADRYCGSLRMFGPDGVYVPHEHCYMALALRGGQRYEGLTLTIEQPGGTRISAVVHVRPVRNQQDEIIGALNVIASPFEASRPEADTPESRAYRALLLMIDVAHATLAFVNLGTPRLH